MGSSIYVDWTDGPTRQRVMKEIGGFDNNHFDGMIDMAFTSSSWLTQDGRAIWAGGSGTQGSMGMVPATKIDPTPPEEGAELVHFAGSLSLTRTISTAFAKKLAAKVGAYWGGVEIWPEFKEGREEKWGFAITSETDRPPRKDLGGNGTGHYYDWSSMIRRAAENRQEFMSSDEKDAEAIAAMPCVTCGLRMDEWKDTDCVPLGTAHSTVLDQAGIQLPVRHLRLEA